MVFVVERIMLYYGYEKSLVKLVSLISVLSSSFKFQYDAVFKKCAKEPKSPTISINMEGFV